MPYVIIAILGVALVFATARLLSLRHLLGDLAEALERQKPFLLERRSGILSSRRLERVIQGLNRLIHENARKSRTEKSQVDQIQATLGSLREAVLIVDEDNFIILANDALRQLIRTHAPLLGHRLETLIQGADFYEYARGIKAGRSSEHREIEVTVGSQPYWLEVTGTPLSGDTEEDGNLTLFVLHNITHLKRLERVRKEFVANVSHELRTPVTIIKGFVDTLLEDHETLSVQERGSFLQRIQKNTERLYTLLEELLLLSRLESTQDGMLRREPVSLKRLATEISEGFRHRLGEGRRLETDFAEADDILELDTIRITQVLNNLMENTLRHAKGATRLSLCSRVGDDGVSFWVEDDGAGIPEKDLPHIFERFYRVEKGRSRESGGTGLGLSIVKHIIQQHGGTTFADSVPGERTRVGFTIPFGVGKAPGTGEGAVIPFNRAREGK